MCVPYATCILAPSCENLNTMNIFLNLWDILNLCVCDILLFLASLFCSERIVFTAVTVGAPTAYSLKFRQGGLARWQVTVPRLATLG